MKHDPTEPPGAPGPAPGLAGLLRADFTAFLALDGDRPRSRLQRRLNVLTLPGFGAVVLHRVAAAAQARNLLPVARLVYVLNTVLFGADIAPRARIGAGFVLPHPQGVTIGGGAVLGRDVRVYRSVSMGTAGHRDDRPDGFPTVGDGAMVCDGARLFGPIRIGDRCTIGAGVRLFDSIPDDSVVTVRQEHRVRRRAGAAPPVTATDQRVAAANGSRP